MIVGDYNCFFIYNGKKYSGGTGIKLKKEYIDMHMYNNKKIWPYEYLVSKPYGKNGSGIYTFFPYKLYLSEESKKCSKSLLISQDELEQAIEEIVDPVEVKNGQNNNIQVKDTGILWVVYIAVMIGSLIFREFYIIWGVTTYVFFKLRKEMFKP